MFSSLRSKIDLRRKEHLLSLLAVFFLLAAIPVTVFSLINFREPTPQAAGPESVEFTREGVARLFLSGVGSFNSAFAYTINYKPDEGTASVVKAEVVPAHLTEELSPEEFVSEKYYLNSKVKKAGKDIFANWQSFDKAKFIKAANGEVTLTVLVKYDEDGELEISDQNGKNLLKRKIKDLPIPTDLAAQAFFENYRKEKASE